MELLGAALIAAVGVGVLGAFIVVEQRREFAILRALGAEESQLRVGRREKARSSSSAPWQSAYPLAARSRRCPSESPACSSRSRRRC
jgi:hypothetical protein